MPVVLSESTANKLRDLLNGSPPARAGVAKGGGVRAVTHVRVSSSPDGSGYSPCVACAWLGESQTWEEYGSGLVFDPQDSALEIGNRYLAVNYGTLDGVDVYVTAPALALGCGLEFVTDADGKQRVAVDLAGLAGEGLEVVEGECPTLAVRTGCGIALGSDDALTVYAPEVAGDGLEVGDDPCQLKVQAGCGIRVDSYGVAVDESLAGDGLEYYEDGDGCHLGVVAGCAITLSGGTSVGVDVPSLAGTGLKVEGEGTCKKLALDLPSYTVVAGACLGQDGNLLITYLDPTTGETWCVESPPCCGDPFPSAPCDCLPPSGTGIVTVSGGAWGTPGPLTGDVTTTGSGLATTITDSAVTTTKIADNAVTHAKYQQIAGKTVLANSAGSTGNVSAVTGSGVLDFVASTQGNLLLRGASTWAGLAIGGANTILTSNGTTASWGYRPLSTRGSAALASNYTITAASGTYVTVPSFSVTVPETGVYWVISNPLLITGGTALNGLYHSLAINGTQNTGTIALGIFVDTNANCQTKNSQHHFLSLTAGDVITMQVMRLFTGTSLLAQIGAESQLVYLRID